MMWRSICSSLGLLAASCAACPCAPAGDAGNAAPNTAAACIPSPSPECGDGKVDVGFLFHGTCSDWSRVLAGIDALATGVREALPEVDLRLRALWQSGPPWIGCELPDVCPQSWKELTRDDPDTFACSWLVYSVPDELVGTPGIYTCLACFAAGPFVGAYSEHYEPYPYFDRPDAVNAVVAISSREDCSVVADSAYLESRFSRGIYPCGCQTDQFGRWCEYDALEKRDPDANMATVVVDWMRHGAPGTPGPSRCRYDRDLFLAAITGLDAAGGGSDPLLNPDGTRRVICESPDGLTRAMPAPRLLSWVRSVPPEQHYIGNICDADLARHFFEIGRRLGELARPCGT